MSKIYIIMNGIRIIIILFLVIENYPYLMSNAGQTKHTANNHTKFLWIFSTIHFCFVWSIIIIQFFLLLLLFESNFQVFTIIILAVAVVILIKIEWPTHILMLWKFCINNVMVIIIFHSIYHSTMKPVSNFSFFFLLLWKFIVPGIPKWIGNEMNENMNKMKRKDWTNELLTFKTSNKTKTKTKPNNHSLYIDYITQRKKNDNIYVLIWFLLESFGYKFFFFFWSCCCHLVFQFGYFILKVLKENKYKSIINIKKSHYKNN